MKIKELPKGNAPDALQFPHFPTRQQAVIWRNWNLVSVDKIASTLKTTPASIYELATGMGLVEDQSNCDIWNKRGYITIIRNNWHLLPYEQILELLDWTPEKMEFTLKEDDFLWHKLGGLKPKTTPLKYTPLSEAEKDETEKIFNALSSHFPEKITTTERPFEFLKQYGSSKENHKDNSLTSNFGMKLAYSYSALYGDPFLDETINPYPDALLAQYASKGINAVWLQGTLYTLVPWLGNSEYSANWELRLKNLRKLVKRAAKYGINIYLYMNEPRNMPQAFFKEHPDWMGAEVKGGGAFALCTSNPEVLPALRDGMAMLFKEVPRLGGVFTITMSENVTHCRTRPINIDAPGHKKECPTCAKRPQAEFPAEVNRAIAEGVHSINPEADVIAWTWAWDKAWDERVIELLPKDVKLMCVSETDVPTDAMGTKGLVLDYSISKPGPGPTAERLWKKAAKCGLQSVAKIQLNNTWECSAIPYIPVPDLVEEHLKKLKAIGISDLMISWTLGGYPGGNIELMKMSKETLAKEKYGFKATPFILKAWHKFSEAFREFPLHKTPQLYVAPQNYGPMNLLFSKPSGYSATMVGFPYDDLDSWRGNHYSKDVFEEQFKKVGEGWGKGMKVLLNAEKYIPERLQDNFIDLFNVSEAAYCHFRSTYLQIKFIRLRNTNKISDIIEVLNEEIELAKRLLNVVKCDSRIGFEASNHYYYTQNNLIEKILNCKNLKEIISS